ncbi:MAG TPA: hypothetical protein VLM89_11575 [Phycisphaerae bacterium]|nr:hypothetical protein [Phycisphaerae bacterium]
MNGYQYGWSTDRPGYDFDRLMARVRASLANLKDYTNSHSDEINRSAWGGNRLQDIVALEPDTQNVPG